MKKLKNIIRVICGLMSGLLFATTINIPADYSTIQAGLNAASEGDIVQVSAGTYIENITWPATNDIKLIGSGEEDCIIDGDSLASVIRFANSNIDTTTLISDFTITNGLAYSGGGIYCVVNSSPSLVDVTITGNSATRGGGIFCSSSSPSMVNVTLSNNSASYGGGIYCYYNSSPILVNVTISNNSADSRGGGIYCGYSSPSFSSENRCNIYFNNTTSRGSGADIYSSSTITVIVDTFTVMNPTEYHASPLDNFTFDILNAVNPQVDADLYVSPDGDNANDGLTAESPLKTIQYATSIILADSTNPHTINLANGIYSPSTNGEYFPVEVINYVSLVGESEEGVILDADSVAGVMRCTYVTSSTISHLTLTNGFAQGYSASRGGGILCLSSSPSLSNVTITGNSADSSGGGIYCGWSSSPSLENVTITGNSASYYGGGISCENSSPSLANVTISGNSADVGGGIYCSSSSPSLANVTIAGNSANYGGGIYCSYNSSSSLVNVTITNNSADSKGGGMYCYSSDPSLANVTITGNSASYGGGMYCYSSDPSLANVTISGNSASYGGGGIYCYSNSSPSLENVTISNNSASDEGGGIYCKNNSSPSLANCILWNDSPQEVYVSSDSVNIFYSDIQGGWDGEGNIDADPLFCDAENDDYHIAENSPCLGTGENGANMGMYGTGGCGEVFANPVFEPTTLDFGLVPIGETVTQEVILNVFNTQIITLTEPSEPFSVTPITFEAEPYVPQTITVTYSPTYDGNFEDVITATGSVYGTAELELYGEATKPQIQVTPLYYDFGGVDIGETANTSITISNIGAGTTLNCALSTDNSHFSVSPTQLTIDSGEENGSSVTVVFSPEYVPTETANLIITSNDPDNPTVYVSLSGWGRQILSGDVSGILGAMSGPYYIVGNVTVPTGQTLTIEPGVEVIFEGVYSFTVNGTLNAEGTPDAEINFHGANDIAQGYFIFENADSPVSLTNCNFTKLCRMDFYDDFEDQLWEDNWSGSGHDVGVSSDESYSGDYSLKVYGYDADAEVYTDAFSVGVNGNCIISWWFSITTSESNCNTDFYWQKNGGSWQSLYVASYTCEWTYKEYDISSSVSYGDVVRFMVVSDISSSSSNYDQQKTYIDDVIITQGVEGGGFPVLSATGSQLTLDGCTISENTGIGISVSTDSEVSLTNTIISLNVSDGIVAESNSQVTLNGCTISENTGIGISVSTDSEVSLTNTIISLNVSDGIVAESNSPVTLMNSVITQNVGYGISTDGPVYIDHATIIHNTNYGLYLSGTNFSTIENSIIWHNSTETQISLANYSVLSVSYSDVQGYDVTGSGQYIWEEGCIESYPVFVDSLGHLANTSPCVDTATPLEQDGNMPPGLGAHLSDMGAYGGPNNTGWDGDIIPSGEPFIDNIADIPQDQGGFVGIQFQASIFDYGHDAYDMNRYSFWRQMDLDGRDDLDFDSTPTGKYYQTRSEYWENVGEMEAIGLAEYGFTAPTIADSTGAGLFTSIFMVVAHTANESIFFASAPASGYSIDNTAPAVPSGLLAVLEFNQIHIYWDEPVDEDFAYFMVYSGGDFVGSTIAPAYDYILSGSDGGSIAFGVSAVDIHHNESELATVTVPVTVTADFSANPTSGDAPLMVTFTDASISGIDPIVSWSWEFGDGGTSTVQNPVYEYVNPGTYAVSLTVTDDQGISHTETKVDYITANAVSPIADFIGDPRAGNAPLTVTFTDASISGTYPIVSWSWEFGDGGTSIVQNPVYEYVNPGTYAVSLTVTDDQGISHTETKADYITVVPVGQDIPPTADFSANPTSGNAPLTVTFADASISGTYPIVSWSWEFGDGGTSIVQNSVYEYANPGTYAVSLTVTDDQGISHTETKADFVTVIVQPQIFADFAADPTSGNAPLTVVFTDVSTVENTTITSWLWDFGDAMTSTEPNPTHIYTIAGVYTVSLTVSDGTIESTETKVDYIVAVNNPPIAADIQKITDEDIFVVIILSGSDADGDALTFEVVDSPTSGVLTGDASDLVYTPVENYFGDDSFTYKVNDGTDDSNIATVSITVNAVNDSPIIEMISDTSFVAGLELKIGLIANDIDEDPLTFSAETDNEDIFATISVDTLVLSANVDFAGESNITVFVSDSELSDSTVFKVTVTQPTSLDEITQIPTEFGLSQNYPNPFNPTTAINYQLPIMSNVQLAIYNVQGRLIETLVNELQDAGFYSVEWIAGDVSSGVYFYRISVETNGHLSFQETKKMVLLR